MTWPRSARVVACAAAIVAAAAPARANPASEELRARASAHLYNLEHPEALAVFQQAVAADPQDAGAYRGLAT